MLLVSKRAGAENVDQKNARELRPSSGTLVKHWKTTPLGCSHFVSPVEVQAAHELVNTLFPTRFSSGLRNVLVKSRLD